MIYFKFRKVSQYLDTTVYGTGIHFDSRLLSVSELEDLVQSLKDSIDTMEEHIKKYKTVDNSKT